MPVIVEYRIALPFTVEEFQVGQLFNVNEMSKEETGGQEGVEIAINEAFDSQSLLGGKYTKGQRTHKIYHLASKVPNFLQMMSPKGKWEIHETSFNAYPYSRTEITNPEYMKDKFNLTIDSLYVSGQPELENALELTAEQLSNRKVVKVDIVNDPVSSLDYSPTTDPTKCKSEKTGRGPLTGALWEQKADPVMTCYMVVSCEFQWWGLQQKMENIIMKFVDRVIQKFYRQSFCSIDKWFGMTIEDIRQLEEKTKDELNTMRATGEVRGMVEK